jgi:hypothetical protein
MGASELLKELVSGDLNLAQDAAEQPRANHFAGVNRNNSFPAIVVAQEMMAPPHTNECKSHPLKHQQQQSARDRWIAAHASTATR